MEWSDGLSHRMNHKMLAICRPAILSSNALSFPLCFGPCLFLPTIDGVELKIKAAHTYPQRLTLTLYRLKPLTHLVTWLGALLSSLTMRGCFGPCW